jgi:hypothetical protein
MTVGRWRSVLVRAGALVALTLLGWCAPATARAGCGDYVVLDAHPALAESAAHPTPAVAPTRPTPLRLPVPCHGPTCGRGSLPPLNAVPPVAPSTDQWGEVGSCSMLPEPGEPAPWSLSALGHPRHRPTSIYHPPRLLPFSIPI